MILHRLFGWPPRDDHRLLRTILERIGDVMATLQQVQDDLTATKTALDSLGTAIDALQSQLAAVLAGNLPPAVQAQVDAIFAQAEDAKAKALEDLAKAAPQPTGTQPKP